MVRFIADWERVLAKERLGVRVEELNRAENANGREVCDCEEDVDEPSSSPS